MVNLSSYWSTSSLRHSTGKFSVINEALSSLSEFFKNNMKGDVDNYKLMKALELAFDSSETTNKVAARSIAHNMFLIVSEL